MLLIVYLIWVIKISLVRGYALCMESGTPHTYSGTINTTPDGNTCQYWTSNSPHSHGFTGNDGAFPLDGSVANAKNYCRNPDNDVTVWCFTTNPAKQWEYCNIPECTDLPCGRGLTAGLSNPELNTADIGTNTNTLYLMNDSTTSFSCCGTVGSWDIHIRNPGTVRMQVWRPDSGGVYLLVGENTFKYSDGEINATHTKVVLQSHRISVSNGDLIGWYTSGLDMISSRSGSKNQILGKSMSTGILGNKMDFGSGVTTYNSIDFAVRANIAISIAPYFTNTITIIRVPQSTTPGVSVLELTATDNDVGDQSSLIYLLEESTYFLVNSGSRFVLVRDSLVAGTYTLTARVVDRCQFEGVQDFTFIVYNEPPSFINWQSTASTSALSTVNGQSITTVTVTDPENDVLALTLICSGCPFTVDNAGIVTATQNLLLHKTSSYDVIITADDGTNIVDSTFLTIYITDINEKPSFTNIPASVSALENIEVGDQLFTVSSYDANGDTVTYSATYSSATCQSLYDIDSTSGAITALQQQDSETAVVTSCVATVTLYDGRESSDPEDVTFTLQSLDEPPVFNSLSYIVTTAEFSTGSTLGISISAVDPEGSAVTFSRDCGAYSSYIDIDSSTAVVSLVPTFDLDIQRQPFFEITCTLKASDANGKISDATLIVNVTDANDNSPVFASGMQTITIHPSTSPGVIGNAAATDDDTTSPNDQISYSITGSSKFTVDASGNIILTGDVSNDPSITQYSLVVTATDSGGLTATSNIQVFVSDVAANANSSSFFSLMENVIWFTVAMVLVGLVAALMMYLLCRYIRKSVRKRNRFTPRRSRNIVQPAQDKISNIHYNNVVEPASNKTLYLANANHLVPGKAVPFMR